MEISVVASGDPCRSARLLVRVPGVHGVTCDPVRRQLVVRHDPKLPIARMVTPLPRQATARQAALAWWPTVAGALARAAG